MSLPATRRSATLGLQALISGRVRDGLTEAAPLARAVVRLVDRDTDEAYPLPVQVSPNGAFAFHGKPQNAFPALVERAYRLRIEASAPHYRPRAIDLDVGPAAAQPTTVNRASRVAGIPDMRLRLFGGGGLPRTELQLDLERYPVLLRGRVHASDDPSVGISGARVWCRRPAGPTTGTDAQGRFVHPRLLPVALEVHLRVSASGFEPLIIVYQPDYTRPVNTLSIGLKRA